MKSPKVDDLIKLLAAKYKRDPKRFRSYLPEVAQLIDKIDARPSAPKSPFGLTERERLHHMNSLSSIIERLNHDSVSSDDAVRGLEHSATLVKDDSLPENIGYDTLSRLLRIVIGKSPSSFNSKNTINLKNENQANPPIINLSIIRGVTLNLDRNMRLVSISVTPAKVKQRRKLMSFVGKGRDTASDVSVRHDVYLAEQ